ncbi:MAG TPA: long-chain-fatty-acid--CoA ligase [Steroidobacteraceae bacterium]|nr:long-chain-fatty-acid--CoA ligase [Steroidobacteraceae bacterium]
MLQAALMMDRPLLISDVIEHAAAQFGDTEIVARETHGGVFRYDYAQCKARAQRLANAFARVKLGAGTSIGSVAMNNHRHLEAYYAVSGSGMIMHTCNPRLHPPQLIYVINHAEDGVLLFDPCFASLIESIAVHCPRVKYWICLSDAENMPNMGSMHGVICYEDFIASQSTEFLWPQFDERTAAALCYTSGTTGNPKGALYSHRSIVLNALSACLPGLISLSPRDTVLPAVPMFHINGWCIPYAAPIGGAKLVLPGQRLDAAALHEMLESEKVTVTAGVPTIWIGLMRYIEQGHLPLSSLQRILVGGSAMPASLIAKFDQQFGIEVRHAWGMTETVAIATMCTLNSQQAAMPCAERHAITAKQGKSAFGVEIKVVDESGATLPRDGQSQGHLMVRGQWTIAGYYKAEGSVLIDGWLPTGDIATIDAHGTMQIRDRAKDLIKTGGEWISSIDLENAAMGHPAVAMAAVIGIKHPRWEERPLLFIVRKPDHSVECDEILAFLAQRVAKWWIPDGVIFLDSLPVGGTGKVQKATLRQQYASEFSS